MKTKIVSADDIAAHPNMSLSPKDYINDFTFQCACCGWKYHNDENLPKDNNHIYCPECDGETFRVSQNNP